MPLAFARLSSSAILPSRKHPGDAGVDVYSDVSLTIPPFAYRNIRSGVTCEVPQGTVLQVWPKGRNNHLVGAGIIDAGYQGEIVVKVVNYSWKPLRVEHGDAIAQLVLLPVICEAVDELPLEEIHKLRSDRGGSGGIHST